MDINRGNTQLFSSFKNRIYSDTGMPPESIDELTINGTPAEMARGFGVLHLSLKSGESIDIRFPEEIPILKSWLKSKSGVTVWEAEKSCTIQKVDDEYNLKIGNVRQHFETKERLFTYMRTVIK